MIEKSKELDINLITHINKNFFARIIQSLNYSYHNRGKYDILITYHHLFETAYLAYFEKKIMNKNTKWVAIFSDPPHFMSPFENINLFIKIINQFKYFFSSVIPYILIINFADKLIFNDIWQAKYILGKKYNNLENKIEINQMGFEEVEDQINMPKNNRKVNINYFGNFYGPRNGKEFFETLSIFFSLYPQYVDKVEFNIYGEMFDKKVKLFCENDKTISKYVNFNKRISYSESLKKMKHSDILLVIDANLKKQDIYPYTPSKIIDYISVRKPILAISMYNSATRDICLDTNNWWSSFEKEEICKVLKNCIDNYHTHKYQDDIYHKYSLKNRNKEFIDIIKKL